MDDLIKFLNLVGQRPAMFGVNKIEDIALISQGFCIARGENLNEVLNGFNDLINSRIGFHEERIVWDRLIRLRSGSDGHSLELFKQEFELWNSIQDK